MSPSSDAWRGLANSVRERIWRYLAANAAMASLAPIVEDVFRLPRGEARRLAAAHLALSPKTGEMLGAADRLLRELPSSITREEIEPEGAIRPPIAWASTLRTRARTARRSAFVTRPPERRYDTSLARLLKLSLTQCAQLSELAEVRGRGPIAATIEERSQRASHLLRHVKLEDVRLARRVPASAARLAARHSASAVPAFAATYADAVENLAPAIMRKVISERLLAPSEVDRLFELYVGFELIDGFRGVGFTETGVRLIPGKRAPLAIMRRGALKLEIWWQRPVWAFFPELKEQGEYLQTLRAAGVVPSSLRPDFIVTDEQRSRVLVVEAKFTSVEDQTAERRGIQNALAYLRDASVVLAGRPHPHGLVVAWGASGRPAPSEIVVCSQAEIHRAARIVAEEWDGAAIA
jgi:hypothetical protein